MCVLLQTEVQLLKSLERCADMIMPTSEIKASGRYHGLGCLTGAEWNAVHNKMLPGIMSNFFLSPSWTVQWRITWESGMHLQIFLNPKKAGMKLPAAN